MPDTNNNDILGSAADLNAGSAIENVQAEEIKRLEAEKQQAEAANPTPQPVPLTAADMMLEAVQEAQARTDAAEARAARFAAPVLPAPSLASSSRPSAFDAAEANARAASRPMTSSPTRSSGLTLSAPPDAGNAFDRETHEQARHTGYWTEPTPQPLSAAVGEASPLEGAPASDPRVAPSPLYTTSGLSDIETRYPYSNNFANRVPEYQLEIEAQRARAASIAAAVSPTEDAPGSFRDRFASYTADWAEVGAAYRQSASEPFAEKFDSFADTAARYGVDTGVLGERVRGVGMKAVANIREDLKSPYGPIQYGYAASAVLQGGVRDYAANNSGQYLTPEQQGEANAGLLPGLGTLAGTLAGSVVPGLGSWAGAIVGQGVGTAAQGILTAGYEREQAVRETGSVYGTATGESAAALRDFTDSLRQANVATKEAYAAFTTLASAGPGIGAGTLPGVALMSGALGERYNPALSGLSHALSSDPILRALQPQMNATGGNLGAGRLGDIAVAEAFSGDWQASNDAATLAEGSLTNPQYAKDANNADRAESWAVYGDLFTNWHALGRDLSGQVKHYHAGGSFLPNTDDPNQYVPGADAERARIAKDRAGAYALYTQGASAEEIAKTGVGLAAARLGIAENQGATDAQLAVTAQTLYSAVASGVPKLTQEAAGIDGYLADHPHMDAATRLKMQKTRDGVLTEAYGMEGQEAQTRKTLLERSLETDESAFGLSLTTQQSGLTRSLLSGRRYDQLAGDENGIVSAENARAGQLRREAYNPLNDPAKRDQMLAQADSLETGALEQQHGFLLSRYSQNLAQTDLQAGQAALNVTTAQITGGPQDVYAARGQELDAYKAKIAELGSELARGGLTVDERIGKERELTDTRRQAAQAAFSRDQSALNDQYQLTGTGQQTLEVGEERRLRRGGNAAFDPALLDAGRARTTEAQSHLDFDLAHYGGNKQLIADDRLRVAQAGEDYQGLLDTKNDYRPTGAFTRQMANDRTAFEVALESPYIRGGAESDPLTRGNAVIKDIRQDMAQNDANRLRGQRDGSWTDDNETAYSQHRNEDALQLASMEREKRFALFNAIPNTIIGGGAMGNSVQSFSFNALTAAYAPNELVGSRGRPNVPRGGELPGSLPGNRVEAFQQHAAASSGGSPASLTTAIQNLAHGMNTQQLTALLAQLVQSNQELVRLVGSGQKLPSQSGPLMTGGSNTVQNNRQSANTNRPSLR